MKRFVLDETSEHVTEQASQSGSRLMPPDTVFIVVRGMILAHTFPVSLNTQPFAFNQDIKAIRGKGTLDSRFLAHWFSANASLFLRKATASTHGTKKLDSKELFETFVSIPTSDEQREIVDRIEQATKVAQIERTKLGELKATKVGLMDDLLSGRVRVTSLLSQGASADMTTGGRHGI